MGYFYSELIKYKKSFLGCIVIIFPIIAGSIVSLSISQMYQGIFVEDIWSSVLIGNKIQSIWVLISISLMSITAALIVSVDKDNNTFKIIFSSSMSRTTYYLEKMITLFISAFFIVSLYNLSIIIVGKVSFIEEAIEFDCLKWLLIREYITLVTVGAIQIFLSLFLKNIIESIAIGIVGAISGLGIISQSPKLSTFVPYSYPYSVLIKNEENVNGFTIICFSVICLISVFILGAIFLKKVDINEVE